MSRSSDQKSTGRIRLEVVSPRGLVLEEMVESVVVTAFDGELGVLPGHRPCAASLRPGLLRYRKEGSPRYMAVSGGFVEIGPGHVLVLARTAELARHIDRNRALATYRDLKEELRPMSMDDPRYGEREEVMARARARLRVVELMGS